MSTASGKRPWLRSLHPLYKQHHAEWATNERRFAGGTDVLPELRRFDWESEPLNDGIGEIGAQANVATKDVGGNHVEQPGQHYVQRQQMALYLNFPAQFLDGLVGQLFRKAPQPDRGLNFGGLGEVRLDRSKVDKPTFAELVYYNTDGVGNDGSQWGGFWADVEMWAGATGHRWLFAEASVNPADTMQQVLDGNRPYLRHLSPLAITNWDYVGGKLAWAIEQLPGGPARINTSGDMERPKTGPVRLYVQQGFTGFDEPTGTKFSTGGWWTFDEKGELLADPGSSGSWEKTKGDIPLWVHFYQRDKRRISRSGTTELGNAAVAYMNLDSAATFDAWDAASSLTFFMNVTPNTFQIALDKIREGSRYVPIPAADDGAGGKLPASVADSSAGAVPATIFTGRMAAIRESVRELASLEASSTADSSGLSKQAGFSESKAPKLALMASEIETSQNIAIHFLELRFGVTPSGSVTWPRDYDLAPVLEQIERMFEMENKSGLKSPTLGAKMMMSAATESGVIAADSEDAAKIEGEYATAAEASIAEAKRQASVLDEFGRGGAPKPTDKGEPEPLF
jgi:hypothetical protein